MPTIDPDTYLCFVPNNESLVKSQVANPVEQLPQNQGIFLE